MSKLRTISSLVKGLRILECLIAAEGGLKAGQIADTLGLERSNITLFLNSLIEAGYVLKNPSDSRYYTSTKLVDLVNEMTPNWYARFSAAARGPMAELHAQFDENVMIGVLNVNRLVIIARLQSTRPVQVVTAPDATYVPHVTSAGKAILAHLPTRKLESYLRHAELTRFTPNTKISPSEIASELETVRIRGYAVNTGEYQEDTMAVAAPIFNGRAVVGALVLQFPVFRHRPEELEANSQLIITAAARVSANLNEGPI